MRMLEQLEGQLNAILFCTWELTCSKEYLTISPPPGQCFRDHSNAQLIMAVLDLNHQRLNLSKKTCEDVPNSNRNQGPNGNPISYKGCNFKLVMVQVKFFEYIQRSITLNISLII
jgi:hypothetical protein